MKRIVIATLVITVAIASSTAISSAAAASIHPGVQTFTKGAQCTSNFIFSDGSSTYIGQAAHCSGTGGGSDTNGCKTGSLPIGTAVTVSGAQHPGTLAYNSWLTMQSRGEQDSNACAYNDLALVRLDPADVPSVDPSVPGFGGPTSIGQVGRFEPIFSFGSSNLRGGITVLSPKQGLVLGTAGDGWSRTVLTVTPGIPGDSGSGFLNVAGQAVGVLSTLNFLPQPATNGVGDLGRELAYMNANSTLGDVRLVPGTRPFTGSLLGAILSG